MSYLAGLGGLPWQEIIFHPSFLISKQLYTGKILTRNLGDRGRKIRSWRPALAIKQSVGSPRNIHPVFKRKIKMKTSAVKRSN